MVFKGLSGRNEGFLTWKAGETSLVVSPSPVAIKSSTSRFKLAVTFSSAHRIVPRPRSRDRSFLCLLTSGFSRDDEEGGGQRLFHCLLEPRKWDFECGSLHSDERKNKKDASSSVSDSHWGGKMVALLLALWLLQGPRGKPGFICFYSIHCQSGIHELELTWAQGKRTGTLLYPFYNFSFWVIEMLWFFFSSNSLITF